MVFAFSFFQIANITLVLILLFLGFKLLETTWSYKISKPHAWEDAVKRGVISKELKKTEQRYRDKVRFYTLWFQIEHLKKESVPGAFAEVGVYQGETAKMIHHMDPSRRFHLFDSFQGFDSKDLALETGKDEKYNTENFSDTELPLVKDFINGNENILFHPGYFPESTGNISEEKYAFVHIDADLYQPTLAALHYFYPKLSPGGMMMVHDYNHTWEGVVRAIREFMPSIPESLAEVPDWQGSVLIIKNKV